MIVEFPVSRVLGFRSSVRYDGRRSVALAEFDPVTVELVAFVPNVPIEGLSPGLGFDRRLLPRFHPPPDVVGRSRIGQAERLEYRLVVFDRLVRSGNDLSPYRLPFLVVGVEQGFARLSFKHQFQLPAKIVGILNRCVRSQPVGGRMPVHGVAHAKDPAFRIPARRHVV